MITFINEALVGEAKTQPSRAGKITQKRIKDSECIRSLHWSYEVRVITVALVKGNGRLIGYSLQLLRKCTVSPVLLLYIIVAVYATNSLVYPITSRGQQSSFVRINRVL